MFFDGIAGSVVAASAPPRDMLPPRRGPPAYNVAAQMARLHRIGRAHSHEGVSGGYYVEPEEDGKNDPFCFHPSTLQQI